jgi:tRNA threonylcarbamoyladenosine biosynthesis protein TsaE
MKILCKNENETKEIAKAVSKFLGPGAILCLDGDLGAGKTTFTQYLCRALGFDGYVNSPSYSIVNEYSNDIRINHFDVYRIYSVEELYEIGYEEYFFGEAITIVEWASKIEELIPDDSIWITIELGEKENHRVFHIEGLPENLLKKEK